MTWLTVEVLIQIQCDLINQSDVWTDYGTGGVVREYATLEYLVDKVSYLDNPFEKAAVLLHGIAYHHPFSQGNKRTAFIVADVLLGSALNVFIDVDQKAGEEFVRGVATETCSLSNIIL